MRHRLSALVAIALAGLLTACSGTATNDTETAGDEPTDSASTAATSAATENISESATSASDSEAVTRIAEAAENTVAEGTASFTIALETAGTPGEDGTQPIAAEGEENFTDQQRRLTFIGPDGELEVLVDGTVVYIQVPGTEDETWARAELEELVGDEAGFGGPAGLPFQSPADNLRALGSAVSTASEGGTEDLDGEEVTRYDLTIDLTQLAKQGPDEQANDTFVLLAEQSGITELDMQVWLDAEERIRQVAYSLDLSQADVEAATEGVEADVDPQGTLAATVTYDDFGSDVVIEFPAEDSIVDLDEAQIRDSASGS